MCCSPPIWGENPTLWPTGTSLHLTILSLAVTRGWQKEQKVSQCFQLMGRTEIPSKMCCSPYMKAKSKTLLQLEAILKLSKPSLMVTWYSIMDDRVEMSPIILWHWLKSIFSPTTGGDYCECSIIFWSFDHTPICILVTWLVGMKRELYWIASALQI